MTPEQFRQIGYRAVDWLAAYMERVERLPVNSGVRPGEVLGALPEAPPEAGLGAAGWEGIFGDLERVILPGLVHWQSPTFFGYFPCNGSGPAVIAELLAAGLNVNGMLWATSPAATELEIRMLDWMADLLDLPACFRWAGGGEGGGCIQGTASESTLIAMLAARSRAVADGGAPERLACYASTQAHSSVIKAAMIAGLARGPEDRARVRLIEADGEFAMRPELLEAAMERDRAAGLRPFYVCATVGTTSSTAIDPLPRIAEVVARQRERPWLHVDAAHAGAACICPEHRWMLAGVEHADSLCFNPHKWLLTNFDCDCFWVRDRAALVRALSITPEYLRNAASESGEVIDFRDWQIPLGRRFRALKLWLVMRHYGAEGLRAHIREHLRLAAHLEGLIRSDDRFEMAAARTMNLLCFRLGGGPEMDGHSRALLARLNESGRMLLTHTLLRDASGRERFTLRLCIGSPGVQQRHIDEAWRQIQDAAREVLGR